MNKQEAIGVMKSKTPVRLRYGVGDGTHDRGVVIDYTDAPTVTILTPDGRWVSWRADLTEIEALVTDCPHIATVTEPRPGVPGLVTTCVSCKARVNPIEESQ